MRVVEKEKVDAMAASATPMTPPFSSHPSPSTKQNATKYAIQGLF